LLIQSMVGIGPIGKKRDSNFLDQVTGKIKQ